MQRARALASRADLVLLVAEAPEALRQGAENLPAYLQKYLEHCQLDMSWRDCLVVLNKADLITSGYKVSRVYLEYFYDSLFLIWQEVRKLSILSDK